MAWNVGVSKKLSPAEVRRREAQVMAAAKRIGIDPETERHMWWIAEFAAQTELPPEWREFQVWFFVRGETTRPRPVLHSYTDACSYCMS